MCGGTSYACHAITSSLIFNAISIAMEKDVHKLTEAITTTIGKQRNMCRSIMGHIQAFESEDYVALAKKA